jgi:hypothetical protein
VAVETFGIEKEFLRDLLAQGASGQAQLPEFQRGWVWPMEGIRSLLASISLGYPVGTLLLLRTGGAVKFKQRPLQGATPTKPADRLILDGQQRLTSLFQALKLGLPIETQDVRKRRISGWFYVDIEKALDGYTDREEAIEFVPADRIVKDFRGATQRDLSTPAQEYTHGKFPLYKVFDPHEWLDGYVEHWGYEKERFELKTAFFKNVLKPFDQYQVPVIELGADTPRQAVCQVFEKVNTGGVVLTVFELLTATFAADEFDLRKDWEGRKSEWASAEFKVLRDVANTDFLQTVTLLATYEARQNFLKTASADDERAPRVGCRRTDILNLSLDSYERWASAATDGFKTAAKLLHQQHVFDTKFLPYGSQLIPLAAIFALLGTDATSAEARQKLTRWLWCGIFGELYGGTTESRFARDVPDVVAWVRGDAKEPRTIDEANFVPARLDTLRTRGSAAYKGLYSLLMKQDTRDWRSGDPMNVATYFDDYVDIHHIFPKAWCEKRGIAPAVYNAITNKTPLSARTNRVIGGYAPSEYLSRLTNSAQVPRPQVDANIATHLVDVGHLDADDFESFMTARRQALLDLISAAMGKPIEQQGAGERIDEPETTDDELDDE